MSSGRVSRNFSSWGHMLKGALEADLARMFR